MEEEISNLNLASPVKRLAACVIDVFLWVVITICLMMVVVLVGGEDNEVIIAILYIVGCIIYIAIQVMFWTKATSIGKKLMNMIVVDKETKKPLSFGAMILREIIGKFISSLILNLGYIWVLIDKDNQGWHDKLVSSIVIKKETL